MLHSHLRMTRRLGRLRDGRALAPLASRAWLVLTRRAREVVQFDGPLLELMTAARSRSDPRLAGLGHDVIGERLR